MTMLGRFSEGLYATGTNHHALPVNFCPLEIGVFAVAVDGIVIAAQKLAFVGGHRFLPAFWASGSHVANEKCKNQNEK